MWSNADVEVRGGWRDVDIYWIGSERWRKRKRKGLVCRGKKKMVEG